jgi:putative ABC transport system permease protein
LLRDLRHAFRALLRKPGFALIAVVTMALGIGATSAIFSVADAILWKSLPLPDAGRVVMLFERRVEMQSGWIPVSPGNFVDWKQQSRSYEHVAAYQYSTTNLTGADGYPGEPARLETCLTGADFFEALGVRPALGRVFTLAETQPGADRAVILNHKYWVRRFAGDPAVVGKRVQIDGRSVSVVGVMPPSFDFPPAMDIWMPLALPPPVWHLRPAPILFSVARLRPGVTFDQARTELDGISRHLETQFPQSNRGWRSLVMPVREFVMGGLLARYTWLLVGVTGFVLLIACANVANLQLARATGRAREIAVRTALGATRWRLAKQLLAESLALSFAGGALGILFAVWGADLIRSGISADFVQDIPNWKLIALDTRALAFTVAAALATGVLSGLAPAFHSVRGQAVNETLKEGARNASMGRGRLRLRNILVAADVALALVLLVGAGLMIKGLSRLVVREQNLRPGTLLTMRMNLPEAKYSDARKVREFYDQLLSRVESLPGVVSAAVASALPHSGLNQAIRAFSTETHRPADIGEDNRCQYQLVSPAYFKTLGISLRAGREFTEADAANAPIVAVISERMARRFWSGGDAVGKRVTVGHEGDFGPWMTIVGVAADVVQSSFDREPRFVIYVPFAQDPTPGMHLAVRAHADPAALVHAVESEVRHLDRELPVYQVETLSQLLNDEVTGFRYIALLMTFFGALALVLASVGVYGVMSYAVSERTQEIGVRIALGARKRDVLALVFRRAMGIALAGVAVGVAAALALARVLAGLVFGVSATDAATFAGVALLLAAVALMASYIPARRATKVDPITALRYE